MGRKSGTAYKAETVSVAARAPAGVLGKGASAPKESVHAEPTNKHQRRHRTPQGKGETSFGGRRGILSDKLGKSEVYGRDHVRLNAPAARTEDLR